MGGFQEEGRPGEYAFEKDGGFNPATSGCLGSEGETERTDDTGEMKWVGELVKNVLEIRSKEQNGVFALLTYMKILEMKILHVMKMYEM